MKTLSRSKLPGAVGAFTAIAGVVLLAAIVFPADPLGRVVGALIGVSVVLGLVGTVVREALARRDPVRSIAQRRLLLERYAVVVTTPRVTDATASEFGEDRHPAFAPVVSLTEAQVERQRSERQRQHRHAALTRA